MEKDTSNNLNGTGSKPRRKRGVLARAAGWLGWFFSELWGEVRYITRRLVKRGGRRVKAVGGRESLVPGGWGLRRVLTDCGMLLLLAGAAALFIWSLTSDRHMAVTVTVDGRSVTLSATDKTVGELLDELGVALDAEDEISAALTEPISDGLALSVIRAFPVAVYSNSGAAVLNMTCGTVGDALRAAGVTYDADDDLSHKAFADVEPGMQIFHTAQDISYVTSYNILYYREIVIKDSTVYKGTNIVEQEGENGQRQVTQRITVMNGLEVASEVVDQVVLSEAVNEIVRKGTKIRYQTNYRGEWREWEAAPTAGQNGWVAMRVDYVTAYCSGTRTACGTRPDLGTIAVNPYYIPYRTRIYVPGYGYGRALDTGAFRNYVNSDGKPVNQLDLWFNSSSEARRWGRKYNMVVYVRLG